MSRTVELSAESHPQGAPQRRIAPWVPFVPYAVISLLHVTLLALGHPLAGPTKLLLMPALALAAVWGVASWAGRGTWPRAALLGLVAAVAASWLGDGAGTFFPGLPELPLMLLWFGVAHVVYIVLFVRTRDLARGRVPWWAYGYIAWWGVLIAVLGPHTGSLFFAVAAYGVLLGATAVAASRCGPMIAWGGVWFIASDSILAFRLFMPEALPAWTSPAVMVTYVVGQGLLVAGTVAALRKRG